MQRIFFSIAFFFVSILYSIGQQMPIILNEKARAKLIDEILEDRMKNLLPSLMRSEGIDMWVIISR